MSDEPHQREVDDLLRQATRAKNLKERSQLIEEAARLQFRPNNNDNEGEPARDEA